MKTCRLKVFPDQIIKLSTPESALTEWIKDFWMKRANGLNMLHCICMMRLHLYTFDMYIFTFGECDYFNEYLAVMKWMCTL